MKLSQLHNILVGEGSNFWRGDDCSVCRAAPVYGAIISLSGSLSMSTGFSRCMSTTDEFVRGVCSIGEGRINRRSSSRSSENGEELE